MSGRKVIDLFSGAGGFTLGATWAGFDVALSIDNDEDLTATHDINFPNAKLEHRDLSQLPAAKIPKLAEIERKEIAGIVGGPPCQGFSEIGKRDANDERNTLVERFFYYVAELRPGFFVMENVPGLLQDHGRPHLKAGLERLPETYECLEPKILDASKFGLPTSRKRVFVIGYRQDEVSSLGWDDFITESSDQVTVRDALSDLPELKSARKNGKYHWARYSRRNRPESKYARRLRELPGHQLSTEEVRDKLRDGWVSGFNGTDHTERVVERFSTVEPGDRDRTSKCPRLEWSDQCGALRAGTGPERGSYQSIRPIHPEEDRVITIREGARLQGFPDWFQFDNTKWHSFRMIGNSVPPPMSHRILKVFYGP
jgi:DNA (cytosine-5)-methyltransferase 1